MSCKYDIIDEGGRKRVRALRPFSVQGREVCPMELGGYVYDANTLSQDGNCWIFSGSLEYPGVRVMDEAIVDMGNNLPKNIARPKAVIISGNSRIMGAISFETQSFDVVQTPAMWEQGGYSVVIGSVPIKTPLTNSVRIPAQLFTGTVGKVAVTSTAYEARLISLSESGIITAATAWTVGGPAVSLTTAAPYILVELRKVGGGAMTPADVTAAGVTITRARASEITMFNSSIVPVYNGTVTDAANILRYIVSGTTTVPTKSVIQNSYLRVENKVGSLNMVLANADFIKVNYGISLTAGVIHHVSGIFRNTNINTPASVSAAVYEKRVFNVSDCPNFEYSPVTFPDLAAMIASGKTFYFKQCNMPVGSALHYYDPKVNTWENLDFTKAMADLGKTAFANTTIVSSNVQGMYRARGNTSGVVGGLLEAASSFDGVTYSGVPGATYDSIIYKDCTVKGKFTLIGRNVFGGTLNGASKITNTSETAMVIDGSFRIEGNAQVTDTQLKGNGYIGGNAELKNGNVIGYIYMQDNAKYIPAVVANPPVIRFLSMRDNAKVTIVRNAASSLYLTMSENTTINGEVVTAGMLIMRDNAFIDSTTAAAANINGTLTMLNETRISGKAQLSVNGDVTLIGDCAFYNTVAATYPRYGKLVLGSSDAPDNLPPTKTTW